MERDCGLAGSGYHRLAVQPLCWCIIPAPSGSESEVNVDMPHKLSTSIVRHALRVRHRARKAAEAESNAAAAWCRNLRAAAAGLRP